ncbi:non-ribosomal peptide synthetase, partial [Kitasatospora griseola]|uniref:non-ribosomal peptide synthetase n=1 Tax=Kitasatospora griseola TaxID=2064 RepID=UPI00342D7CA4
TDVSGDPTFRELLGRVRETALGAYAHQDLPFERLVQDLQPERSLAHGVPLFNVDCMLQNAPFPTTQLDDLEVSVVDRHTWTAKSDLGLMFCEMIEDGQQQLVGWYEYSEELFDRETIERFVGQLLRVLDRGTREPDTRVSRLPLLTDAEIRDQLTGQRAPARPSGRAHDVLARWNDVVREHGDRDAVVIGDLGMTYRELDQEADLLAARLGAHGVGTEDRVAVFADRSFEMFIGIIGTLKAGGAFVPMDPDYPPARVAAILADATPRVVVRQADVAVPADAPVLDIVPRGGMDGAGGTTRRAARAPHPSSLAYLMYTSGSTGTPKGVMIEHRELANLVDWLGTEIHQLDSQGAPVGVFNADFTSDAFIEDLCLLFLGATMHIPDRLLRKDPWQFAEFLGDRGIEFLQCSPTQMQQLLQAGVLTGSKALRRVVVAGEEVVPQLWDVLAAQTGAEVWNVYGPTECTVDATAARIVPSRRPNIGRPVHHTVVRILDAYGNLLPVGARGEIHIGGAHVGRGYLNRAARTAAAFVPDPYALEPGARLYRTGDIGSRRPDGSIEFHGRIDDQVKVRGHRVELGEIESVVTADPRVHSARVVLSRDDRGDDRIVAYVVPSDREIAPEASEELVAMWRGVFDIQQGDAEVSDSRFDTSGWNDTSSSRPLSAAEMTEWLTNITDRIRRLRPRRVLEIGCGTGLVLFRLLPDVESYIGTDFSAATLAKLQAALSPEEAERVRLLTAEAADLSRVPERSVDTAVLNSVIQYFAGPDHLVKVLDGLVPRLVEDGAVFLGDLRPVETLRLTHLWIESQRLGRSGAIAQLRARLSRALARERELLVSPRFVQSLPGSVPGLSWVEHSLQQGRGRNEMVRFRYDAILHREPPQDTLVPGWAPWSPQWDLRAIERFLTDHPHEALALSEVDNSRLREERALLAALDSRQDGLTVAEAIAGWRDDDALDPHDVFETARACGREARVTWSPGREDGAVDVVVLPVQLTGRRVRVEPRLQETDQRDVATVPLLVHQEERLVAALRESAIASLPDHMVPHAFVLIDELPINAAGKLDRSALPAPFTDGGRPEAASVPPTGPVELAIARLWQELLVLQRVGANDNFFSLGGHSLLATTMVNRINKLFNVALGLRDAFERPVLRELAVCVGEHRRHSVDEAGLLLPVLRDASMPLSFAQERLWLMDQLAPGSAAYNIPHALRFR